MKRSRISAYAAILGRRGGAAGRGSAKRRPVIRCGACGHAGYHHWGLDGARICQRKGCKCRNVTTDDFKRCPFQLVCDADCKHETPA